MAKSKRVGRVHMVIPDGQVKPGVDIEHWTHIGNYIVAKRPDVIVNIGDFADMPSLSMYAVGKAEAEGTRYADDIKAEKAAMKKLLDPMRKDNRKRKKRYAPEMHLTLGNHEDRITREAESNPKLIGTISVNDLGYKEAGWKVHDFLKVVKIDGIEYSHYFVSGAMGRPVSSASALLRTRQCSAVMGHVQRHDIAIHPQTQNVGLFCGIAYTHDEKYLTEQGNNTKRGIWMLNEVRDGTFDIMFVSLEFLKQNHS
jgi:hypothetical protein